MITQAAYIFWPNDVVDSHLKLEHIKSPKEGVFILDSKRQNFERELELLI